MGEETTRVCFLTGSDKVPTWMEQAIDIMVQETDSEVTLIVKAQEPSQPDRYMLVRNWLEKLRDHIITLATRNPEEFTSRSDIDSLQGAEYVECLVEPASELGVKIPKPVVALIAEKSDVVIHYDVGILQGDILSEPEKGVLSFHHGNLYEYRGGPAGFWEFMNDERKAGVTLQRLNEDLDAGEIIDFKEIDISGQSWPEIRERLYAASHSMLATGIKNLQKADFTPTSPPSDELGEMYYLSDLTHGIKIYYFLKEIKRWLSK